MQKKEVFEIDLLKILLIIKKNIILFVAIILLCAGLGYGYSHFLIDETFTATAKLIVVKDDSSTSSTVTYSDIQLSQKLTDTYAQIIMSEAVSDEVIKNLDLENKYNVDQELYEKMVSAQAVNNTEVMTVSVTSINPELSADMANEIVSVFIKKLPQIMNIENALILANAKVPTKKSGPSNTKYALIGALIGLAICLLITIIKYCKDNTIKTEEDVKNIFDYPIIGIIPKIDFKENYDDRSK